MWMRVRVDGRVSAHGYWVRVRASAFLRLYASVSAPPQVAWSAVHAAGAHAAAARNTWGRPPVAARKQVCLRRQRRIAPPRCLESRRSEGLRPSGSPLGNRAGSPNPSAGDVIDVRRVSIACLRCEVWMAMHAHGLLAARGRLLVPRSSFLISPNPAAAPLVPRTRGGLGRTEKMFVMTMNRYGMPHACAWVTPLLRAG
jgi:hypothetical protein